MMGTPMGPLSTKPTDGSTPAAPKAAAGWSWYTEPLTYKDKCALCGQMLRADGSQIVKWTDGYRYHVGCLLDLVSSYKQFEAKEEKDVKNWTVPGVTYP